MFAEARDKMGGYTRKQAAKSAGIWGIESAASILHRLLEKWVSIPGQLRL